MEHKGAKPSRPQTYPCPATHATVTAHHQHKKKLNDTQQNDSLYEDVQTDFLRSKNNLPKMCKQIFFSLNLKRILTKMGPREHGLCQSGRDPRSLAQAASVHPAGSDVQKPKATQTGNISLPREQGRHCWPCSTTLPRMHWGVWTQATKSHSPFLV